MGFLLNVFRLLIAIGLPEFSIVFPQMETSSKLQVPVFLFCSICWWAVVDAKHRSATAPLTLNLFPNSSNTFKLLFSSYQFLRENAYLQDNVELTKLSAGQFLDAGKKRKCQDRINSNDWSLCFVGGEVHRYFLMKHLLTLKEKLILLASFEVWDISTFPCKQKWKQYDQRTCTKQIFG